MRIDFDSTSLPLFSAGTLQERLQPGSPIAAVLQVSLQSAQDVGGELPKRFCCGCINVLNQICAEREDTRIG